jgi:hypothetical protein
MEVQYKYVLGQQNDLHQDFLSPFFLTFKYHFNFFSKNSLHGARAPFAVFGQQPLYILTL